MEIILIAGLLIGSILTYNGHDTIKNGIKEVKSYSVCKKEDAPKKEVKEVLVIKNDNCRKN